MFPLYYKISLKQLFVVEFLVLKKFSSDNDITLQGASAHARKGSPRKANQIKTPQHVGPTRWHFCNKQTESVTHMSFARKRGEKEGAMSIRRLLGALPTSSFVLGLPGKQTRNRLVREREHCLSNI